VARGAVCPPNCMRIDEPTSDSAWILAGEDGVLLAASRGFARILTVYPELEEFLKMWHRILYRGRQELPPYEREIAGRDDQPVLRIKATPLFMTVGSGPSHLSDQVCGILVRVQSETPAAAGLSHFALTLGESRVAELVVEGKAPVQIAGELGISVNTVRVHMKRLFLKTNVHSRADLVRVLIEAQMKGTAKFESAKVEAV